MFKIDVTRKLTLALKATMACAHSNDPPKLSLVLDVGIGEDIMSYNLTGFDSLNLA